MAFLLAACKDAEIEVSKYVKAPQPTRSTGTRRKRSEAKINTETSHEVLTPETPKDDNHDDMDRITVSLRNMTDGYICFPAELKKEDAIKAVKAAIFMMKNYYELETDDIKI